MKRRRRQHLLLIKNFVTTLFESINAVLSEQSMQQMGD
jgi:hypothetical protein